jgi:hypothetical protein
MRTDFKVYPRKIHVYRERNVIDPANRWVYAWSTNAHPTCKSAVADAKTKHPNFDFKASFAKD